MIPDYKAVGRLRRERILLGHRAPIGVVHAIAALPLWFGGTFKNVRCAKKSIEQPILKSSTGRAIGHLGGIIRRPPDLIRASWRWSVGAGAARNTGAQAIRIGGGIRTKSVGHVDIVVVPSIHDVSETNLLQIVQTLGLAGLLLGASQCGKKHRSQNGDDRNHYQQFDQGESAVSNVGPPAGIRFRGSDLVRLARKYVHEIKGFCVMFCTYDGPEVRHLLICLKV